MTAESKWFPAQKGREALRHPRTRLHVLMLLPTVLEILGVRAVADVGQSK